MGWLAREDPPPYKLGLGLDWLPVWICDLSQIPPLYNHSPGWIHGVALFSHPGWIMSLFPVLVWFREEFPALAWYLYRLPGLESV